MHIATGVWGIVLVLTLGVTGCSRSAAGTDDRLARAKIGFIFIGTRDDLGYNPDKPEGKGLKAWKDLQRDRELKPAEAPKSKPAPTEETKEK